MSENREDWKLILEQLKQRSDFTQGMGGANKIAIQHAKGRLTARERVALLCEGDSFNEYGELAGGNHPGGEPPLAGDALVGGTGRIGDKTVVIIAEDFTVKGGSIGHPNSPGDLQLVADLKGIDATPEELGSASMHTCVSGVADNIGDTEQDCFAMVRYFLSLVSSHSGQQVLFDEDNSEAKERATDALLDITPPQVNQAYDMRKVLDEVCDDRSVFELQPNYGKTIITALARIGGVPCLIVANQPTVQAGAITADAAKASLDEAQHIEELQSGAWVPADAMAFDKVIDPAQMRNEVIRVLHR